MVLSGDPKPHTFEEWLGELNSPSLHYDLSYRIVDGTTCIIYGEGSVMRIRLTREEEVRACEAEIASSMNYLRAALVILYVATPLPTSTPSLTPPVQPPMRLATLFTAEG